MSKIETVLFDIDGTLDDSNDGHAQSWVEALAEAGFDVAFERIRPLIGLGGDKLLPELGLGLDAHRPPGSAILKRRRELFLNGHLASIKPFPGARELVARLRAQKYCCIVASSASEEELTPLLRIANVEGLFAHAMTPGEVESSKPAPDIVRAALAWSETAAESAVMIGDSRYDIEAANRAGVRSIALRCGGTPDERLTGATAIFDDPADLLAAIDVRGLDAVLGERLA